MGTVFEEGDCFFFWIGRTCFQKYGRGREKTNDIEEDLLVEVSKSFSCGACRFAKEKREREHLPFYIYKN